jgi:hypothetical protein
MPATPNTPNTPTNPDRLDPSAGGRVTQRSSR